MITDKTARNGHNAVGQPLPEFVLEPATVHPGGKARGLGRKGRRLTGIDPRFADRLYRYGFAALDRTARPRRVAPLLSPLGWTRREIGSIDLWTHPETALRVVSVLGTRLVFLGDAVPEGDPAHGDDPFSPEALAPVVSGGDPALHAFLDTLAGRFALLVIEPDRTRVFHDPMGARSVFYAAEGPFAVASHAALLADCLGTPRDPKVRAHIHDPRFRARKTKSLPGDLTLFRDIFALVPNNQFDSATMRTRRYWPREPLLPTAMPDFLARLDTSLGALARYVAPRYRAVFGATGGADSRLAMAGFHKFGVGFESITWCGEGLTAGERDIIRQLVTRMGAPHRDLEPVEIDPALDTVCRRDSGGYRPPYASTFEAWAADGDRSDVIFIRGHGAEIARGFYNLGRHGMTTRTPAECARLYFDRGEVLPEALLSMFEDYHRRGNCDGVDAFGCDPNDLHYWEHRMGMWSSSVSNEFDVAMRSVPAFNSRPLFAAAFGLPPRQRLTKQLFLDATARYAPHLADLPIDKPGEAKNLAPEPPALPRREIPRHAPKAPSVRPRRKPKTPTTPKTLAARIRGKIGRVLRHLGLRPPLKKKP